MMNGLFIQQKEIFDASMSLMQRVTTLKGLENGSFHTEEELSL